jgi:hypothetical protein
LGERVITKSILETAGGLKMWQSLRSLSDYVLLYVVKTHFDKQDYKALPFFLTNQ